MPDRPIAVFAPADAAAEIDAVLTGIGVAHASGTWDTLAQAICDGSLAGAILHEETLPQPDCPILRQAIADQPPWSDFPILLLTGRATAATHKDVTDRLGHVMLVELPVDPAILANAVCAALRSRRRQREAAAYLHQREEAEQSLLSMKDTLESHVRERTADLKNANERLLREIDERRAAEERLRESEELYRHTVELTRQQVWTAAPDGTILSRSRQLSALDDSADMSMTGTWIEAVHPDDRETVLAAWEKARRTKRSAAAEFRIRLPSGEYHYFRARTAPRLDERGQVVRWYGATEDIDEQKLAELARLQAEERYRLAIEATNDAVWDHDIVGNRTYWSDTAAQVLGYPGLKLGDTDANWWRERIHPDDREQTLRSFDAAIRQNRSRWSGTYRFRKANGDYLIILDRGFVIHGEDGKAVRVVGAMADLTERQRAEEAVRRMQAELIHVSRLSAMGTMASTLAHELNQPLTAVTNFVHGSRRLLEHVAGAESAREALASAESGALRAGQIVRRLRDLVARGRSALRPEDLPRLVEDAGTLAFIDSHLLGVSHTVEIEPDARWVEVDRVQIQQVLINLVRNGIQAMQEVERREIAICARSVPGQMVEVSVADTGRGIEEEVREALFSPFQGTKEEGLGIGLSICRTIIEAHGGKIWAEDRDGGGTLFRFTVPRYEGPAPKA